MVVLVQAQPAVTFPDVAAAPPLTLAALLVPLVGLLAVVVSPPPLLISADAAPGPQRTARPAGKLAASGAPR
jgi:hypothetical protein